MATETPAEAYRYSWTAFKKALSQCGGDSISCSDACPTSACPEFHIGYRLGWKLFSLLICCYRCLWNHELQSKWLYYSVVVTPSPVRIPTLLPHVPSFTSVVGYAENISPCPPVWFLRHPMSVCCMNWPMSGVNKVHKKFVKQEKREVKLATAWDMQHNISSHGGSEWQI